MEGETIYRAAGFEISNFYVLTLSHEYFNVHEYGERTQTQS